MSTHLRAVASPRRDRREGIADRYCTWANALCRHADGLVQPGLFYSFAALADALPVRGDSYYAELRLAAPRQQLDLLLALDCFTDLRVTSAIAARTLGCEPDAARAWSAAENLLRHWTVPGGPWRPRISTVWLEFDDVTRSKTQAAPSLSACIVPGYTGAPVPGGADGEVVAEQLKRVYRLLAGPASDAATCERLELCTRALPVNARIIHLSVMTARSPQATKLYLCLPRAELFTFLRAIGWSGSEALVEYTLLRIMTAALSGPELYIDLNLDNVHQPSASTLGLAFAPQQLARDPGRRETLRTLVREGQCSPEHAPVLLDWITSAPHSDARSWLDLKTVVGGSDDAVATKAYLGFGRRRSPFARRDQV